MNALDKITDYLLTHGLNLLFNIGKIIIVIVVGLIVISIITKAIKKALDKSKLDDTLKPFLTKLANFALKVILVIIAIEIGGIDASALIAVFATASLAVGLAFQGALANFAGGLIILVFRPYKVGDVVNINGFQGQVTAIEVIATKLTTVDNQEIVIPNGVAANSTITNITVNNLRRVDFTFGVAYESDLKKVKQIITNVVNSHEKVLKDPAPFVRLGEQADSSLNYIVRLWTKTPDYWDVHFDIIEQITDAFNDHGISIPYPQIDLHQK